MMCVCLFCLWAVISGIRIILNFTTHAVWSIMSSYTDTHTHFTEDGSNPRRSNSLGSLSDPDCYMNSLWPRVNPSYQVCVIKLTPTICIVTNMQISCVPL